jgi:hypothetical protein
MKTLILLLATLSLVIASPAAERSTAPGWKRLWLPVVKWEDSKVTPLKFPTPWWTDRHLSYNRATGRY